MKKIQFDYMLDDPKQRLDCAYVIDQRSLALAYQSVAPMMRTVSKRVTGGTTKHLGVFAYPASFDLNPYEEAVAPAPLLTNSEMLDYLNNSTSASDIELMQGQGLIKDVNSFYAEQGLILDHNSGFLYGPDGKHRYMSDYEISSEVEVTTQNESVFSIDDGKIHDIQSGLSDVPNVSVGTETSGNYDTSSVRVTDGYKPPIFGEVELKDQCIAGPGHIAWSSVTPDLLEDDYDPTVDDPRFSEAKIRNVSGDDHSTQIGHEEVKRSVSKSAVGIAAALALALAVPLTRKGLFVPPSYLT